MKQIINGGKIEVHCPFVEAAPARFRQAGGKWSGSAWIFSEEDQEIVDEACRDIYSVSGREETAVAEITVKEFKQLYRNSIIFCGFALSAARGRDGGAKTGDGVQLKSGKINSGGSMKNWKSTISEGSVFIIKEFPVGIESTVDFEIKYLNTEKKEEASFDFSKASDSEILEEAKKRKLI